MFWGITHFTLRAPKNIGLHAQFIPKWAAYNISGPLAAPLNPPPSLQTKYEAYPIDKYRVVQTGPNTQLGGRSFGKFNLSYHSFIAFLLINAMDRPPKLGKIEAQTARISSVVSMSKFHKLLMILLNLLSFVYSFFLIKNIMFAVLLKKSTKKELFTRTMNEHWAMMKRLTNEVSYIESFS
jgi:hypothetical protein